MWSKKEIEALLESYAARKDELVHFRKKKYAYQNILEDLSSQAILVSENSSNLILILITIKCVFSHLDVPNHCTNDWE